MKLQKGFTLIELMVVVVIVGILATIGAPSFSDFINNTRLTSTMTQLNSDLNRARSEAIKRNSWVMVCARGTNTDCGADWNNGWLVCQDSEPDNACDTSTMTNPNPLAIHPALNPNLTLAGSAVFVRFNPSGTQGAGGAATLTLNGTWTGVQAKTASIAATGHISKI